MEFIGKLLLILAGIAVVLGAVTGIELLVKYMLSMI